MKWPLKELSRVKQHRDKSVELLCAQLHSGLPCFGRPGIHQEVKHHQAVGEEYKRTKNIQKQGNSSKKFHIPEKVPSSPCLLAYFTGILTEGPKQKVLFTPGPVLELAHIQSPALQRGLCSQASVKTFWSQTTIILSKILEHIYRFKFSYV